ncbi:FecR domain-containing protein [Glaciimonas sp. PCH181]|uniref:FecR domain-containing protein n=1 Tax=Glaciimonas sp. PCH181 TaxID=2133943 RepID=UPI000D3D03F5|nr:FecR family protein [Glaciimonas sp. PCH181]PUA19207.1 histidine kinase [Glaciimonas sp. PCH181]
MGSPNISAACATTPVSNAISTDILEQAADWLMQLNSGTVSDEDRAACERWRRSSPDHARAWMRAELLLNKLGGLPPSLAISALDRPVDKGRRAAVVRLAILLAAVPTGWLAWRIAPSANASWHSMTATHITATGEQRSLTLADGSRVTLNTSTAVDVQFDTTQRLLQLRAGEIFIATSPDPAGIKGQHRPFRVSTAEGRLEALGTRFSVRQYDGRSEVSVLQGAVRIEPVNGRAGATHIIHAGQQASFTTDAANPPISADDAAIAWMHGMLLADSMRLADFARELARYRKGFVYCDPVLANMPVSGAFPITDTDRALTMLVSTYPLLAVSRLGGYWVTLVAR